MARYTLVIGNRNYSSWSLRAWLAMQEWMTAAREETEFVAEDEPYAPRHARRDLCP